MERVEWGTYAYLEKSILSGLDDLNFSRKTGHRQVRFTYLYSQLL